MTVAVVCLALIVLALLGTHVFVHVAHTRERRELLDRIQFPDVTKTALTAAALPEAPKREPEPPVYAQTTDPDLLYLQELA